MDSYIESGYLEAGYKHLTHSLMQSLGGFAWTMINFYAHDHTRIDWELWPILSAYRVGDVVTIEVFITGTSGENDDICWMDISYEEFQAIPDVSDFGLLTLPPVAYLT